MSINNDRVVPMKNTDLITLYSAIFKIHGTTISKIDGNKIDAKLSTGNYLASEPVESIYLDSSYNNNLKIYFVADYNFKGISTNDASIVYPDTNAEIAKDGVTLYELAYNTHTATITKLAL